MTTPEDPFATPDQPAPQQPGYGQPPSYGQAPGYGQPPSYGQTPYGQPPAGAGAWQGPPLASWHVRAGGYLIDILIAGVIQSVFSAINVDLGRLVGLLITLGYGYLTGTTGQTPGRRVVGVKILREQDGQYLGPVMGIVRGLLHILDALPLLLGFFWPIWDAKKQTFADKIVKSVAIKV